IANQLTGTFRAGDGGEMRRTTIVAALLCFPLLFAGGSSADDLPLLIGTVGPGFTIDLTDANGVHVDQLVAGKYTLLVHDLPPIHTSVRGSRRTGERLATTEVEFVGDMTFTIALVPGLYVYACSPHFMVMNGSFWVSAPPNPAPPVTPLKVLSARVSA